MKLLRLTTRKDTAFFEASYNGDLVIPAKSKIALQSVSIKTDPQELLIDDTNNKIEYQVATGTTRTVFLPQGFIAISLIDTYFLAVTNAFNASCVPNFAAVSAGGDAKPKRFIGMEWLVERNAANLTQFGYKIGAGGENVSKWDLNNVQRGSFSSGGAQRPGSYRATNPTGGTPSGGDPAANTTHINNGGVTGRVAIYAPPDTDQPGNPRRPYPLARGHGYSRCRILEAEFNSSVDDSGFVWGVFRDLEKDKDDIRLHHIDLAIHATATDPTTHVLRVLKFGVAQTLLTGGTTRAMNSYARGATNNDRIEMCVNGPNLECRQYDTGSSNFTVLFSEPFEQGDGAPGTVNNTVVPVFAFFGGGQGGDTKAMLDQVDLTPSPYGIEAVDRFVANDNAGVGDLGAAFPPKGLPVGTTFANSLFIVSPALADFLGFNFSRVPRNGFIEKFQTDFEGTRELNATQSADTSIVEFLNLQLDSYDSFSDTIFEAGGQRRNILSVIPESSVNGSIAYEPPYPTFIDLNNNEPLAIRNLKARVVRSDYSDYPIRGLATLVVLIGQ